ncbi:hypothetical protein GTU79_12470 [Sodalis ligni]|nr:hypothetical protein GTU79_12470 [Sodalis ligni]
MCSPRIFKATLHAPSVIFYVEALVYLLLLIQICYCPWQQW